MPVGMRVSASAGTSFSAIGARGARRTPPPFGGATTRSSASVFQPSHAGQRPTHFGDCAPQFWQTNAVLGFGAMQAVSVAGCRLVREVVSAPVCLAFTQKWTRNALAGRLPARI